MKIEEKILRVAVASNTSLAGVIAALDMKVTGAAYERVKKAITHYGIQTDHFLGQGWSRGLDKSDVRVAPRGNYRKVLA